MPKNNKSTGVGNNVSPTSTTNAASNSHINPVLANYGSFYDVTSAGPSAPQSGQAPSSNDYPPLLPLRNANYPPPNAQPGQAPSPSIFSEPIPANTTSSFSSLPPSHASTGGYRPTLYYPPAPQSSSNYPPAPQSPSSYPPSSPSNYNRYPGSQQQQPSCYPLFPINQMFKSPRSCPSYPPSNVNFGYLLSSVGGGQGAPGIPQPTQDEGGYFYQQPDMPRSGNPNQGCSSPPPLSGNRPNSSQDQHDQNGYPSYS